MSHGASLQDARRLSNGQSKLSIDLSEESGWISLMSVSFDIRKMAIVNWTHSTAPPPLFFFTLVALADIFSLFLYFLVFYERFGIYY